MVGGMLAHYFNWRAPFWFLSIVAGLVLLSFLLAFRDPFRRERSMTYQMASKQKTASDLKTASAGNQAISRGTDSGCSTSAEKSSSANDVEGRAPVALDLAHVKLSLRDVAPFRSLWLVVRRKNNMAVLVSSGE
jgi:hypothetical protein